MAYITSNGTTWTYTEGAETWTNTSSSSFPPESGWSLSSPGGLAAITVSFNNNPWVETGEFKERDWADFLAHPSGSGNNWQKFENKGADSDCHMTDNAQYKNDKEWTPAENDENEAYFTQGTCGTFAALRDVSDDLILDVDGNVIYTGG